MNNQNLEMIAKDVNYAIIQQDLESYCISDKYVKTISDKTNPTSYIIHSQDTSSRSIVHYRDLPEYSFDNFIHGQSFNVVIDIN